jgi:hypothetical protein
LTVETKVCEGCGTTFARAVNYSAEQWRQRRFCSRPCAAQRLVTDRPCACGCGQQTLVQRRYVKGHRPLKPTTTGYRRIWVGKAHPLASTDGNALAHRIVLYNAGIEIPDGYDVHHRNGDKLDNRLENLEVLTDAEHTLYHLNERGWVTNQYGTFPLKAQVAA